MMFQKTITFNTSVDKFNVYLSPLDSINGPRLMSFRGRATTEFVNFSRNFSQFNGALYHWNSNDADESGVQYSSAPISITPFNYQQGYWIVVTIQMLGAGQEWIFRSCQITN